MNTVKQNKKRPVQLFFVEINRSAPKGPDTRSARLLGQIRYMHIVWVIKQVNNCMKMYVPVVLSLLFIIMFNSAQTTVYSSTCQHVSFYHIYIHILYHVYCDIWFLRSFGCENSEKLPLTEFLNAVGQLKFRGTSVLFRLPHSSILALKRQV